MDRQPYQAAPAHRYPSTSSAFSASANPNEDWTKISDLAERRRIQNRIAQRNYRKKLKRRLEDLEKRAASSSASPEPKPVDLVRPTPQKKHTQAQSKNYEPQMYPSYDSTSQAPSVQYISFDDRTMFSEQFTRQMSTSPPPLLYTGYSSESMGYTPYTQDMSYPPLAAVDMPIFPAELPPLHASLPTTLPGIDYSLRQESYLGPEMNTYHLNYTSMANIDMSAAQSFTESNPHVGQPFSSFYQQR